MKIKEMRDLDTKSIEGELKNVGEQLFRIRFHMSMGQSEGLGKYRNLRKDRARMLGILREREITGVEPPPAARPLKSKKKEGK